MEIPGDTGHPWRLMKYIEYMKKVGYVDSGTYLPFIENNGLDMEDMLELVWNFTISYCIETAIFQFYTMPLHKTDERTWNAYWDRYRDSMVFISARRYSKANNWFVPLTEQFHNKTKNGGILSWLWSLVKGIDDPNQAYMSIYQELMTIKFMGRFSTDLFMEALVILSDKEWLPFNLAYPAFDWDDGSNVTTGIMNAFYEDEWADERDKSKTKLSMEDREWLDEALLELQDAVKKYIPEMSSDISAITPRLCSYRNLYKSNRYPGFHHDRQLETIRSYQEKLPEFMWIWDELFGIRYDNFPHGFLGELNGWDGIRPKRKKLWVTEGLLGIEDIEI